MAKKKGKGGQNTRKKAYLTPKEWKILIGICCLLAAAFTVFLVCVKVSDKSLPVKDGKVVTEDDGWLVCNASDDPENARYYRYGACDFSGMDVTWEKEEAGFDERVNAIRVYPGDHSYESAQIYANRRNAREVAYSVYSNIGKLLTGGDVHPVEQLSANGATGYVYWYTQEGIKPDADGNPVMAEDGSYETQYAQVFSCYMPCAHDGCIVTRVNYAFDSPDQYVSFEEGCARLKELLKGITLN